MDIFIKTYCVVFVLHIILLLYGVFGLGGKVDNIKWKYTFGACFVISFILYTLIVVWKIIF